MIGQTPGGPETETARMLRQVSGGYADLPDEVAHRLDRVLDTLPAADTLHRAAGPEREGFFATLAERLRPKRVRYALASGAAAVLVTVGAVAVGLQSLATQSQDAGSAEVYAEEDAPRSDDADDAPGGPESASDSLNEESEEGAGTDSAGITGVAWFASGTDYTADTDLLGTMRAFSFESTSADIPAELAELAAGGDFWHNCEEAIAREYQSLLVAVDFARYESAPAIIALLMTDQGELAVALSPACADGVIEALAVQP
ncbi:hypothetical protein SAMN05216298_4783 [Glycomyces sambucus]|uniref:Uncharacterized protein n=1 Tax=Glycomyces sambucus TaxID=380244 RepID=A0A1G9M211_9ACTN|nr:hypothetical protein [Glycomyces sambucus]SDL68299.1 hypothetical protein SAMN05216298_4783 [Glycomyces sambucus]